MKKCYVFICLDPAQPVIAAAYKVDKEDTGYFAYGKSYEDRPDAFSLDPENLKLGPQQFTAPGRRLDAFGESGTFGVLSDAGPNAWGRSLTLAICKDTGKPVPQTPVDWLVSNWHYGAGCLGFSDAPAAAPAEPRKPCAVTELDARCMIFLADPASTVDPEVAHLLAPGASLGGVRPKTAVMHKGTEYIAKFNKDADLFDMATVEYASLRLAFEAGIQLPDFDLVEIAGRNVLLTQRFDRTPQGGRIHYISANSLMSHGHLSPDKREYVTSFSYAGIVEKARQFSIDAQKDARELYRRMVLNLMIGNVDDHLRNHGFLMAGRLGSLMLSPAFDILPHLNAATLPQSIGMGSFGAASTIQNALSQCKRFFLQHDEAVKIIGEVKEVVSRWRHTFADSGVSQRDINTLSSCFELADAADQVSVSTNLLQ